MARSKFSTFKADTLRRLGIFTSNFHKWFITIFLGIKILLFVILSDIKNTMFFQTKTQFFSLFPNIKRSFLASLLLFLHSNFLFAQYEISGIVTDVYDEPLAFVNILINNKVTDGVTTGIDGRFFIERKEPINQLKFSYVGYENQTLGLSDNREESLKVVLKVASVGIEEVTVLAGENPAHRIIKKVVKNRDFNNPEKQEGYRCNTYNKVVFDWMPNQEAIAKLGVDSLAPKKRKGLWGKYQQKRYSRVDELSKQRQEHYLFLMESVTDRKHKAPQDLQEIVLHNRVSGFSHPSFAALANAIQPFSFYKEHLDVLDKSYLNPISPGSTTAYYFSIQDTLYHGKDSTYIIHFKSRKGKKFDALTGLLYINTKGYAIQNVIAEPEDPAFVSLKIEQEYSLVGEETQYWFPTALNFELHVEEYPDPLMGLKISGKSHVSNVQVNPKWEKKAFAGDSWMLEEDAHLSSDSFWLASRPFPLTKKELLTYEVVDSIGKKKHFDQFLKGAEALMTGKWPIGKIDFLLDEVLSLNEYEDIRLGAGFETNDRFSKWFSLMAYGGYGFEDKAWKYGGGLRFHLLPQDKLLLTYEYNKDLAEAAALFTVDNNIFSNRFYAERMNEMEAQRIALRGQSLSFLSFDLSLEKSDWRPGFDYRFQEGDVAQTAFSYSTLGLYFRYAFGEQTINIMGSRFVTESYFPILELAYSRGLKTLNGEFSYNRISAAITQFFPIRRFGEISYRLEAGMIDEAVPFHQLYTSNTLANDSWFNIIDNSFQTLAPYEFTSDRFAHFYFSYEMAGPLIKTKYFRPRISLLQNIGYGDLEHPELHKGIPIKAMEKGHFESGVRVGNILRIPYLKIAYIGLGAGVYYRYGAYQLEEVKDNFAYNFVLDFSF